MLRQFPVNALLRLVQLQKGCISPYVNREFPAAYHPTASANQSVTINVPHEKPEQLPQCFRNTLKHGNEAKDWLSPSKTFQMINAARSLVTSDSSFNKMKEITFS